MVGAVNAIAQSALEEIGLVAEAAGTNFANLNQGIADVFNQLQDAYAQAANKFVEATVTGLAQITQNTQNPLEQIYQTLSEALQKSVTELKDGLRKTLACLETDIQNYAAKAVEDEPWWKKLLKALVFIAVIVIAIFAAPVAIGLLAGVLGAGAVVTAVAGIIVGAALGASLGALSQIANNAIDGKNLMDGVGKAALAGAIGGAIGGLGGALGGVLSNVGKLGAGMTKSFWQYGIETVFDTLGEVFGNLATGEPITAEGILMGVAIGTAIHVPTAKAHGINKRTEVANTFNKRPDLVNQLPNMKPDEINALAKETGMDAGQLQQLAKLKPDQLKKYVDDAKQRTSQADDSTVKLARWFERTQQRGNELGQRVGSAVASPIKSAFGGSRGEADVSTTSTRTDVGTETPRGVKLDTDVPMTSREREILENTAPKDGSNKL